MSKVVITYGTFDLFHVGHLNLLTRLKALGDRLVVGVSTDEFNELKGKRTIIPFEDRVAIVGSLKVVDSVLPENSWDQKRRDIDRYEARIFGMGDDWQGKFDDLSDVCEIVYLPRTQDISTSELRRILSGFGERQLEDLAKAVELLTAIRGAFGLKA